MLEVCDETEVAELKLKVNFESLLSNLVSLTIYSCCLMCMQSSSLNKISVYLS